MTRYMRKRGEYHLIVLNPNLDNIGQFEVMPDNFDVQAYNDVLNSFKGKPPHKSYMEPENYRIENKTESGAIEPEQVIEAEDSDVLKAIKGIEELESEPGLGEWPQPRATEETIEETTEEVVESEIGPEPDQNLKPKPEPKPENPKRGRRKTGRAKKE